MIFRDSEEGGPREFTRIDLPAPQPEINLRGEMAEEVLNEFYPDLNELESKVGRKTPESLLAWMKDAADREGWTADPSGPSDHTSDGLSDKINTLKQEMRWLRCADVRILRQLVAVHEGIEAMRWLMEERGLQTSRCSSLSGSLSSLVTIEEHVPSTSPCREDPTPAFPQSIRLAANTKPADQNPSETSEPQSPSKSILVESHTQGPLSAANSLLSADAPKSEAPESGSARFHIRNGAETIKRALLRSSRRKQLKAAGQDAGEKNSERPTQQSLSVFKRQEVKKDEDEEESSAGGEKDLLGYDAQWSWVESKDDVTFL
ncbi:leucine rich adaptor protein 1-like [Xiphophorus hellerii]|uniref:leucine rich adaptor protein 1-like n=1 Tax=Xiphophorus hellerii TaxID=8084 RepID=UPI0013B3E4A7|nr:leucine rich adaptor protein 1-like [Xiphophorus hellerii]